MERDLQVILGSIYQGVWKIVVPSGFFVLLVSFSVAYLFDGGLFLWVFHQFMVFADGLQLAISDVENRRDLGEFVLPAAKVLGDVGNALGEIQKRIDGFGFSVKDVTGNIVGAIWFIAYSLLYVVAFVLLIFLVFFVYLFFKILAMSSKLFPPSLAFDFERHFVDVLDLRAAAVMNGAQKAEDDFQPSDWMTTDRLAAENDISRVSIRKIMKSTPKIGAILRSMYHAQLFFSAIKLSMMVLIVAFFVGVFSTSVEISGNAFDWLLVFGVHVILLCCFFWIYKGQAKQGAGEIMAEILAIESLRRLRTRIFVTSPRESIECLDTGRFGRLLKAKIGEWNDLEPGNKPFRMPLWMKNLKKRLGREE